ncbi:hypothetical protein PHYSODRAFT_285728 [Phytophthora sojae]|uniref:Uncharacterized protein n=1 Tax=Phytophthora sojae (strain P6497) TaxID=1094619 RepID=G4Z6H7_PHYSP|nr:hypothetical protein PHYSODRAFT_285728 [Phytophthora sojae]EGZ22425.1 hypothetical protein PHYSODRAFT_285728 [Phytophthora sojae]|eukprot:XP_009525142.1 hypothetical protein PHYSODRAFT_285728 [Phytophthora sojae]
MNKEMKKETPGHGLKVEYQAVLSISGSSKKLRTCDGSVPNYLTALSTQYHNIQQRL